MVPWADVLYAMDKVWWDQYGEEAEKTFTGERWAPLRYPGVRREIFNRGKNSGVGAISLAAHWGARKIILLGYDCQLTGGRAHWHEDHPKGLGNAGGVKDWPAQFTQLASRLRDVAIVNCTRDTALTCFERIPLKEALGARRGGVRPRSSKGDVVVDGMQGLGDSIYQRAFLKNMPGAYVVTPWPELYSDLDLQMVKPNTKLRTQAKNAERSRARWVNPPAGARRVRVAYGPRELAIGSILDAMRRQSGVKPGVMDLPRFGSPLRPGKPTAIVRPVTERAEWHNKARSPDPKFVHAAIAELRRRGYYIVSVADLEPGKEWLVGPEPKADLVLHRGQWDVTQLLGAIQAADVVVGGVGWIVPACIAAGTPLYVIHGGQGGHNHRSKLTAPWMDLSKVGWAEPKKMCMCTNMLHRCNKEIHGFDEGFRAWLDGQGLFGTGKHRAGVAPRVRDGLLPSEAGGHALRRGVLR